jgi:peptidoglycan LD-endopeptidase CwlK
MQPYEIVIFLALAVAYGAVLYWGVRKLYSPRRIDEPENGRSAAKKSFFGIFESARLNWARPARVLAGFRFARSRNRFAKSDVQKFALMTIVGMLIILFALVFAEHQPLDLYERDATDSTADIRALLEGDALVPPPALPPAVFVELEQQRPALASADRDWVKLQPEFRIRLLKLFKILKEKGYPLALLEGYRSPARQDMLANLGPHVTNARAFQSQHQYGLAADVAPIQDGKIIISEDNPWALAAYNAYGDAAKQQGLVWGGSWRMRDFGHVELRKD